MRICSYYIREFPPYFKNLEPLKANMTKITQKLTVMKLKFLHFSYIFSMFFIMCQIIQVHRQIFRQLDTILKVRFKLNGYKNLSHLKSHILIPELQK